MKLNISPDIKLPVDGVTEKLAFLGRTGSGKTYGATKVAEEMLRAGAQVIVIDPVGKWYGLRLAADGKSPGISIPVFGGLNGDIPLEPTSGAVIADLIVDRRISLIMDVSQFEIDAHKTRFATDFATRFFFRQKSSPSAVHVFVEESEEFVPQNPQPGENAMLHAFRRMWKLGRNFGIGGSLISQRPQDVNKKALNQSECVFAFQMTGPQERKAIETWIADKGLDLTIAADLPKLPVGQCHIWSPQWLQIFKTIKISPKWTFDASSTPKVGQNIAVRDLAPIDLVELQEKMQATIERAKENDPALLKKEIAKLKTELARKPAPLAQPKVTEIKVEKVPVLTKEHETQFQKVLKAFTDWINFNQKWRDDMLGRLEELTASLAKLKQPVPQPYKLSGVPSGRQPFKHPQAAGTILGERVVADRLPSQSDGDGDLPKGVHRVLTAVAQYPDGVSREQLSVLTGYTRSSRNTYLFKLSSAGYVESQNDLFKATSAGIEKLGDFEPLPTGSALMEYWTARLPQGERIILEHVAAAFPNAISREDLSANTGYTRSSRNTYLFKLKAKRLVETTRDGLILAAHQLFDGACAPTSYS